MVAPRQTTIYLDPALYEAIKLKALDSGSTMSRIISRAVRASLAEDLEDLESIEERAQEPSRPLAELLQELSRAVQL